MPVDRHLDIGSQLNWKKKSQGGIVEGDGEMLDDACDGDSGRRLAVVPLRMIKWRPDLVPRFERPNWHKWNKNFNHWIVIFPVKGLPTRPLNNQDLDRKIIARFRGYITVSRRSHFPGSRRIPERKKPGIVSYEKRMKNRHLPPL